MRAAFIDVAGIELQLRFEDFALAGHELEIDRGNHFAGAFADADVAEGEFPRIAPIAVERRVLLVRRNVGEIFDHLLAFGFADALDESLKRFASADAPTR